MTSDIAILRTDKLPLLVAVTGDQAQRRFLEFFTATIHNPAAAMANHASTRTAQLYDRRSDEVTLDEVERVLI